MATLDQIVAAQLRAATGTPTGVEVVEAFAAFARDARSRGALDEIAMVGGGIAALTAELAPAEQPATLTDEEMAEAILSHVKPAAPAAPTEEV